MPEIEFAPKDVEFSTEQIGADPILQYFVYAHLPPLLAAVSRIYALAAWQTVMAVQRNPERTVALRKLLEAKDAAVRAALPGKP